MIGKHHITLRGSDGSHMAIIKDVITGAKVRIGTTPLVLSTILSSLFCLEYQQ